MTPFMCLPLFGLVLAGALQAAAQGQDGIACTPERPVAFPREKIHLNAWTTKASVPARYDWSADAGKVSGAGAEATWDFTGVSPGIYTATVTWKDTTGAPAICSIRIIVADLAESPRGIQRLTGRSLLDGKEADGYGLYSYLLFANAPDDFSRERYAKSIEAYASLMPDILNLEKYVADRHQLAILYAPIQVTPPKSISSGWILQNYDYAHASVLLNMLPAPHGDGPYLLSALTPLTGKVSLTGPYLFQDLSRVPPNLVRAWLSLFLNQTAQERFWEAKTTTVLGLRLRTAIGVLAMGLPDVQTSLHSWISWEH